MKFEYWYIELPPMGSPKLKGESVEDHANRGLAELVERGWEPTSVTRPSNIGRIGFLMRKPVES